MFPLVLILIAVAFVGYVRLAPSSVERWHVTISAETDKDINGGAIRVIPNVAGAMTTLEEALKALPRTTLLAGSGQEGHMTYVTRSKVWAFPDYTTIQQSGDNIKMFARLRFGSKDLGVNAARLKQLIGTLDLTA